VVPAGGLAPDHSRWIDSQQKFFLPVDVLKKVFRGKFVDGLKTLHGDHKLGFHGTLAVLQNPKASQLGFDRFSAPLGWFTPNVLSAVRNMRFVILDSTPIVWRSQTIASSR
jgi:Putative transposase